ncbi:unnamed protein product [Bemisia tabaci]|uniref:Uncharacterized protein n=1 Tax=Bemisia tabaci TaxID=7038 RepID=A0A9P0ABR1_BEMTA|nr:unnamed protein product [Bemisia tabaci]
MGWNVVYLVLVLLPAIAQGLTLAESGSWCYEPANEAFWGHATAACCPGEMGSDRRCYGLIVDEWKCQRFYRCCIRRFNSNNSPDNPCS